MVSKTRLLAANKPPLCGRVSAFRILGWKSNVFNEGFPLKHVFLVIIRQLCSTDVSKQIPCLLGGHSESSLARDAGSKSLEAPASTTGRQSHDST